ncbi:methylated-DNA--[protein]-cysteine S-methyltransferase [uncultured Marinobacter sp.]|uniref:methylated-DNA--[protein]-cysteine S-methyltransferase n=1 Tax=uncultured Marinobacter sp. TaxID=187379 RepID=UPI00258BFDCA|nr:methylated-DNA--[protein]-cysteine S-methyltransferase [uncultured Marinobacter sp.]
MHYGITPCSQGQLLASWSEEGLCAIELGDTDEELVALLHAHFPGQVLKPATAGNADILEPVRQFVDTPTGSLPIPLSPKGTVFQKEVWQALLRIPAGTTVSYSELARMLGRPKATRAVATACAANKLAVVIPCHRVVRSDGSLGGYRWGIERKRALLNLEATLAASAS